MSSSMPAARCIEVRLAVNDPMAIPVVPPSRAFFSSRTTFAPFSAALTAAANPLPPPPTTITS
jgi:hypothetical protein